jgi:predicted anti-sigma-YlaC factor YlaD
MAKLDGESVPVKGDEYDTHVAGCEECREVIAGMTRLHARLDSFGYETALSDLWPAIQGRIVRRRLPSARERLAFAVLAALVLVWRTAQLVFDVPIPVLNALVPLAVAILIGWWVAGDPLAIQSLVLEEQQERA